MFVSVATQCLEAVYDVYRHDDALSARLPMPAGGLQEVFDAGIQKLDIQPPPKKVIIQSTYCSIKNLVYWLDIL